LHPLIGVLVGVLIGLAFFLARQGFNSPSMNRTGYALLGLYFGQILLGGVNVILRAPVWMQLMHLLVADLIWILLVIMAAQRLAVTTEETVPERLGKTLVQAGD
jgi:heme a synthase